MQTVSGVSLRNLQQHGLGAEFGRFFENMRSAVRPAHKGRGSLEAFGLSGKV